MDKLSEENDKKITAAVKAAIVMLMLIAGAIFLVTGHQSASEQAVSECQAENIDSSGPFCSLAPVFASDAANIFLGLMAFGSIIGMFAYVLADIFKNNPETKRTTDNSQD